MADELIDVNDPGSSPEVSAPEPFNPVLDQAVKAKDFSAFHAEKQADTLRKLGVTADTQPGAPAAPVPDTAKSADADKPGSDPSKPGRGKEKRIPQLDADIQDRLWTRAKLAEEIAREEGRLEALRQAREPKDVKPAASSPAKSPDGRPKLEDFEADPATYPDPFLAFTEALAEWKADQVYARKDAERMAHEAEDRRESAKVERLSTFKERVDQVVASDPEALSTIDPRLTALKPLSVLTPEERKEATPLNALADVFLTADDPVGLMRYFSDHPEEVPRVCQLLPDQFYQAIGRIVASLPGSTRSDAPAPKTQTTAPPPPDTLGSRPAASGDPLDTAVKRHDTGAFLAAKHRQRMVAAGLTR